MQSSTPNSWSGFPRELAALEHTAQRDGQQTLRDDTLCKAESGLPLTLEQVGHYADPLEALKERDLFSLAHLFQRDDIYDIEADLNQMLLRLLPAPCWEEDPFEFLQEFL
jgi:hypothetical protein